MAKKKTIKAWAAIQSLTEFQDNIFTEKMEFRWDFLMPTKKATIEEIKNVYNGSLRQAKEYGIKIIPIKITYAKKTNKTCRRSAN